MTLRCPLCQQSIETGELAVVSGTNGGFNCPRCGRLLHFTQGYPAVRSTISFILSSSIVYIFGVRNLYTFVVSALALWIPSLLFVNAYSAHIMPLGLKPWRPPASGRTLIQRLNERNAPIELLGKREGK